MDTSIVIELNADKAKKQAKELNDKISQLTSSEKQLQKENLKLNNTIVKLQSSTKKLDTAYQKAKTGNNKLQSSTKKTNSEFQKLNITLDKIRTGLIAATTIIIAASVIKSVVNYADAWFRLNATVNLALREGEDLAELQDKLYNLNQKLGSNLGATIDLYLRLERSSKGYGITQKELLETTEAINLAMIVSAATTESANAAIIQLGQGMETGFNAASQELQSVREQLPELYKALEQGLKNIGVQDQALLMSVGLKKYAEKYSITADKVTGAMINQSDALKKEFDKIDGTMLQGYNRIGTSTTKMIGTFDQIVGGTRSLSNFMSKLSSTMDNDVTPAFATWGKALTGNLTEIDSMSSKARMLLKVLISLGLIADLVFEPFEQVDKSSLSNAKSQVSSLTLAIKKYKEQLVSATMKLDYLDNIEQKNLLHKINIGRQMGIIENANQRIATTERQLTRARAELTKQTKLYKKSQDEVLVNLTYEERIQHLIGNAAIKIKEINSEIERATQPSTKQTKLPTPDASKLRNQQTEKERQKLKKLRDTRTKLFNSYKNQIALIKLEGRELAITTAIQAAHGQGVKRLDNKVKRYAETLYDLKIKKQAAQEIKSLVQEKELLKYEGVELEIQRKINALHQQGVKHIDAKVAAQMREIAAVEANKKASKELADIQFKTSLVGLSKPEANIATIKRTSGAEGYTPEKTQKIIVATQEQTATITQDTLDKMQAEIAFKKTLIGMNTNEIILLKRMRELKNKNGLALTQQQAMNIATEENNNQIKETVSELQKEIDFKRSLIGLNQEEIAIRTQVNELLQAGVDINVAEKMITDLEVLNKKLKQFVEEQKKSANAWDKFGKDGAYSIEKVVDVADQVMDGFAKTIHQKLTEGKSSFRDFKDSVIAMISEIAIKMAVVEGVAIIGGLFAAGSTGSTGSTGGGTMLAHTGGMVGAGSEISNRQITITPSLPRFHNGGSVLGYDEIPAILQTGEKVLSRQQVAQQNREKSNQQSNGDIKIINVTNPDSIKALALESIEDNSDLVVNMVLNSLEENNMIVRAR